MRQRVVSRLLFSLVTFGGLAIWVACGDTDGAVIADSDAGSDTGTSEPIDTGVGSFVPIDTGAPPPKDASSDAPLLPPYDPGPEIFIDGGPDFDGGIACFDGGVVESESNDDQNSANTMPPTRCGVIEFKDGGAEKDIMTFNVPDAATGFRLYYFGQVHVNVSTAGHPTQDISIPGQSLPLEKNQPYYVELTSRDGGAQGWKLVLLEDGL